MKTFINAVRVLMVALLFVSLNSLAFLGGCCNKKTTCNTGCKLQPEAVQIRKTCDHPGYYKQVCHLEYVPCQGKEEVETRMPIYLGCYDEQGNKIDGNGSTRYASDHVAYTNDVQISTQVPASYTQGGSMNKTVRSNRKVMAQ